MIKYVLEQKETKFFLTLFSKTTINAIKLVKVVFCLILPRGYATKLKYKYNKCYDLQYLSSVGGSLLRYEIVLGTATTKFIFLYV